MTVKMERNIESDNNRQCITAGFHPRCACSLRERRTSSGSTAMRALASVRKQRSRLRALRTSRSPLVAMLTI